ncbi:MAG: RteC domain-containing protein [Dysgonomonas sp.]
MRKEGKPYLFLSLLEKKTSVDKEVKEAYLDFITSLDVTIGQTRPESAYRELSYIRIDLISLMDIIEKEDLLKMPYIKKAIAAIDVNLQLITWQINSSVITSKTILVKNIILKWTGKVVDLVELSYSLVEAGCVNNGNINIKDFIYLLSTFFNFEIKDCFNVYREIRKRKFNRTTFLDELKNSLLSRMDDADNGVFGKRR